jgi:hypothetical protein
VYRCTKCSIWSFMFVMVREDASSRWGSGPVQHVSRYSQARWLEGIDPSLGDETLFVLTFRANDPGETRKR